VYALALALVAVTGAINLDQLATPELLTADQVSGIKASAPTVTTRAQALSAIKKAMLPPGASFVVLGPTGDGAEHPEVERALAALERAEVVSAKTAQRLRQQVQKRAVGAPLALVMLALKYESDDDWWNPGSIAAFSAVLRKNGVVDSAGLARIKAATAAGQIPTPFELLPFCKHAVAIDLRRHASDPALFVPAVHREAAAILPELAFDAVDYKVVPDKLRVTLVTRHGSYSQDSFFGGENDHPGPERLDRQTFYQVFNKMLADAGSGARIHLVKFRAPDSPSNADDQARFGLILLTPAQAKSLRPLHDYGPDGSDARAFFDVSYEDFHSIGPLAVAHALKRYRAIGLLDHLDPEQAAELERAGREQDLKNLNGLLALVPKLAASFWYKDGAGDHPYADFLAKLTAISRGRFAPTEVVDTFLASGDRSPTTSFGFTLAGRKYSTVLKREGAWLDASALELVRRAVAETDRYGRFYFLEGAGEDTPVVYLTRAQYRVLRAESLAKFEAQQVPRGGR
jgi:hypothetical protein